MDIRKAAAEDLDTILELFEETVRKVNSKDYSEEQIEAWLAAKDQKVWLQKIKNQSFYVAVIDDQIVGFSSIDSEGYLDFLFVHSNFQGEGIAQSLLRTIEVTAAKVSLNRIWTSASITAEPFFSKHGYERFEYEHRILSGVRFKNALMEKKLS